MQSHKSMHSEVTAYINNAEKHRETLAALRQLIHDTLPDVTEEFKWGRPVFKAHKDFAYLKKAKAYVTLGFFDFKKLQDPDNLLEGTGKDMRHIKLKSVTDIKPDLLTEWFKAAILN